MIRLIPLCYRASLGITRLLVLFTHRTSLHAGPSTLLSILTATYHIEGMKKTLQKISRTCVVCQKAYARTSRQLMGELPTAKTHPARPFSLVGIDFTGPIQLKEGSIRKPFSKKVYIAVFITGAILVVELTTQAFLATLDRFIARRGIPEEIFSDNGTNFVGTYKRCTESLKTRPTHHSPIGHLSSTVIGRLLTTASAPTNTVCSSSQRRVCSPRSSLVLRTAASLRPPK